MKKRCLSLVMAAVLLAGSVLSVHAEEYTGGDGWKVRFTGDKMESNFSSSDISDAIYSIQPGDKITIHVTLENQDQQDTDWYISNEVLDSLEDSQNAANGGAYTYILTYTDSQGKEETLYSSETVGGERSRTTTAGEGLHEATDNLEAFFYLDRLSKGGQGRVTLSVALDGETQGNTYQDTLAKIKLNFAVERVDTVTVNPSSDSAARTTSDGPHYLDRVQTGDQSNLLLWSAAALVSGLALLIFAVIRHGRRERRKQHE